MLPLLFAALFAGQDPPATRFFKEGNKLHAQGKYAEALAKFEESLKLEPDVPNALFNAGMAAFLADKPARAAELWDRLKTVDPEDRRAFVKLVQAYQAAGKNDKRDAARKELIDYRKKMSEEERGKFVSYCRDQFRVGETQVMAFEYFELEGERPLRYRFSIVKDGKEAYFLSLGSYEITTRISRELGEIGPNDRMFHLDGYFENDAHSTFGMFKKEPSYDDTRKMVSGFLEKKR